MRRIFLLVFSFVMLMSGTALAEYPDYLGGDKNLLLCGGHMGVAWYVDKSSLVVQKYAPPVYRIAVNVLTVEEVDKGNREIASVETCYFLYYWDTRKMYQIFDEYCHFVPPVGCMAETGHAFPGEMAFYLAYHKKFYGGQEWKDPSTGELQSVNFTDQLYATVDGAE